MYVKSMYCFDIEVCFAIKVKIEILTSMKHKTPI